MPAAQKIIPSEGTSGVLNLKGAKAGRRGGNKWKKKFALLRRDTLHLYEGQDENGKGEEESHTIFLGKYKECTHILDKRGRKKPGFTLIPSDASYEQWMLTCDDITEQEKWISQLNSAISGNIITIINLDLDDVKIMSPALHHLSKTRPKHKGRRAPSKRPRTDFMEDNGIEPIEDPETTTVDSVNPPKKARSSNVASPTSPTLDESKASGPRAFFRGIGLKVSTALGRQKSGSGSKTPQSPEPVHLASLDIAPEDRMSLSTLLRTLQKIETQSGTIVNKAAALRVLFQGATEDSKSLGRPAMEVERGLQDVTNALDHLSLAEELQMKLKEDEERERALKEEMQRKQHEEEEAARRRQEEEREKSEEEAAEERRRDEEEQELHDEEDRKQEEERVAKENAEKRTSMEELRLAEKAGEEEEEMWQSGDEDVVTKTQGAAPDLESNNESIEDKATTPVDVAVTPVDTAATPVDTAASPEGKTETPKNSSPIKEEEDKSDSVKDEDEEMQHDAVVGKEEGIINGQESPPEVTSDKSDDHL